MEALVKGAESVFTTKTVVGEATKIDDTIIIPLVDVSFGIGAGASCGAGKDSRKNGGMGGMSGKMSPSAVLLIKNGQTRLVNIKNQDSVSKVIDMIPDLVDRFKDVRTGALFFHLAVFNNDNFVGNVQNALLMADDQDAAAA